jgi:hypothetical protein
LVQGEVGLALPIRLASNEDRLSYGAGGIMRGNVNERWTTPSIGFFHLILIPAGVPERFLGLKIVSAENNCGWLPFLRACLSGHPVRKQRRNAPSLAVAREGFSALRFDVGRKSAAHSANFCGTTMTQTGSEAQRILPTPDALPLIGGSFGVASRISETPASWKSAKSSETRSPNSAALT